jgi:hypothetical protein
VAKELQGGQARHIRIGASTAVWESALGGHPQENVADQRACAPLPDFPPVILGALWRGKATPLVKTFLEESKERAKELSRPARLR